MRPPNLYFTPYRARDGGLVLGALTPENRSAIRQALGLEGEDQDDPRIDVTSDEGRLVLEERKEEIRELMLTRTVADWIERLDAVGAPASPVNFPEELPDDPQASLHYVEVEHPLSGTTRRSARSSTSLGPRPPPRDPRPRWVRTTSSLRAKPASPSRRLRS